jgi:hypothetical protein
VPSDSPEILRRLYHTSSPLPSVTPTLNASWLAERMVGIINSGLSDHLVAPHFAKLLLPTVRSMPEWFRWVVNKVRPVLLAPTEP